VFEDYPADEDKVDTEDPKIALKVATTLKDLGTAAFKNKDFVVALAKYQKALRYLDVNGELPVEAMDPALGPDFRST
jgi:peptidyl-prolyl isomerase D